MRNSLRRAGMWSGIIPAGLLAGALACAPINPTITDAANGTVYRLLLGATLSVQLPSAPEADGCQWRITQLNQVFLRRIDNFDTLAPGVRSQLDDGTWVETFKFQGVIQGTTDLSMEYLCGGTPTGTTFTLRVHIVGSGI